MRSMWNKRGHCESFGMLINTGWHVWWSHNGRLFACLSAGNRMCWKDVKASSHFFCFCFRYCHTLDLNFIKCWQTNPSACHLGS